MKSFLAYMRKPLLFSGVWFFVGGWYLPVLMSQIQTDAWTRPANYMIVGWGVLFIIAGMVGFRLQRSSNIQ